MPRLLGVDIPSEKRIEIALQYIFGVGPFVAKKVAPLSDKLGFKKLRDALMLCTDTQFMTRTTGVDATLAIELLVVKLAAPVRPAQTAEA